MSLFFKSYSYIIFIPSLYTSLIKISDDALISLANLTLTLALSKNFNFSKIKSQIKKFKYFLLDFHQQIIENKN